VNHHEWLTLSGEFKAFEAGWIEEADRYLQEVADERSLSLKEAILVLVFGAKFCSVILLPFEFHRKKVVRERHK
jgi:hypothetical protein